MEICQNTRSRIHSFFHSLSFILQDIVEEIDGKRDDTDATTHLLKELKSSRQYLKTDFKLHVKHESFVPDHCASYGLNDPNEETFQTPTNHAHDMRCTKCEQVKKTIHEIEEKVFNFNADTAEIKNEMVYKLEIAKESIESWKKHQIRTVNQDRARNDIIGSLQSQDVHMTLDWAMKFLPQKGRED